MKKSIVGQGRFFVFILFAVFLQAGCGRQEVSREPPLAEVETLTVQPRLFTLTSELPGRIEPVRVAEVRARVAGIVLSRHFQEGSDVKAGQLLFQIDPAPFKATLARAQGELAKAEAALAEARSVVRRYEPLVSIEAVSQLDFETAQATQKSAQAACQAAAADVEMAKLNLAYATVTAPISGRIGRALVTEGALVGQNEATPLAIIQQLTPIYADFRQPVADMLRLREALATGRLAGTKDKGALISLSIEGSQQKREGRLMFSDITVDRSTGQVSLRGLFDNADALLLPGMYVRVTVNQGDDPQAILVPQRAVQRSSDGKAQVLVVDQGDVAQVRPVRTGEMHGGEWHILEGLNPGERVIVGGAAQAGSKVRVVPGVATKTDSARRPE